MNKEYTTTKKHYKIFKKEFKKWYRLFDLYHIEIVFSHGGDTDFLAWTSVDSSSMCGTVCLEKDWSSYKPTKKNIKKIAFHECMEVLLFHLRNCAEKRFLNEHEIDEEIHRLIHSLEKVVFEPSIRKKYE